jgi:ABC-2 type transport system ATP-binding protein
MQGTQDRQPVLQLKGVHKSFGGKHVLRGISLDVPPGSIFALLGENGAGKSTTMRILAGLLPADRGDAVVLGKDAYKNAVELRHRVGYVPEKPRYYDWMNARELGWFTAGFHGPGYFDRYERQLDALKLDSRQQLKTLSKGQYAKVGLALALALEPEVLLLDEPTSGLDLFVRREFLTSMVRQAAEGRTLLLSSHQISEVERVASHVAFLAEGQVLFSGSMDDLRRRVVAVTLEADRAPRDWSAWGTVLRLDQQGKTNSVVLLDPNAEALGDLASDSLTLEGVYEALLAGRDEKTNIGR